MNMGSFFFRLVLPTSRPLLPALATLALLLLSGKACAQAPPPIEEIKPPDVFRHIDLLRQELEELRAFSGSPKDPRPELEISGAEPRDVFFQALTLFRKANRYCFEQTRERAKGEPRPAESEILPRHVYATVDAALKRVLQVKKSYGIKKEFTMIARDESKTPSEVMRSIIQANRQLNLLLERRFAPSDAYQQVTVAIGYTERLLGQFSTTTSMPKAPPLEPYKMPGHVFGRLLDIYEQIRKVSLASGLKSLTLKRPDAKAILEMGPSDVYDIASMLVSELNYLHSLLPEATPPRPVYYPGRKIPTDVFQRAGILDRQLSELERLIGNHPDWLTAAP